MAEADSVENHMLLVLLAWGILKTTSCALDFKTSGTVLEIYEIFDIFAYVLYLPSLIFGPVLIWNKFNIKLRKEENTKRYGRFLFNMARFLGWALVLEISLHYFYVTGLQSNIEVIYIKHR